MVGDYFCSKLLKLENVAIYWLSIISYQHVIYQNIVFIFDDGAYDAMVSEVCAAMISDGVSLTLIVNRFLCFLNADLKKPFPMMIKK